MRWQARVPMLALAALAVTATLTAALAAIATNAATNVPTEWPMGLETVRVHPFRWVGLTVAVGCAVTLALWWVQHIVERRLVEVVPAVERPEPWVIGRPREVDQVVSALRRGEGSTIGITTTLHGAGGFGKTTVAKLIRSDPRVLRRFGRRVYWVTLGRDVVSDAAIAARVNDLMKRIAPERAQAFTDARQAGAHLGALLDTGPRRLVILDDVWLERQLEPFLAGGRRCARLVTTRNPSLIGPRGVPVRVDQVSPPQARAMLTWDLPPLPDRLVEGLLRETGRWPLLLRLVNTLLAKQVETGTRAEQAAADITDRLRRFGGPAVDDLTGVAPDVDLNDADQRRHAARATIRASTDLLAVVERTRLDELAIFVEDETVPVDVVYQLWQVTGGLDRLATGQLVVRLKDLALLSLGKTGDDAFISMHDVIRDYLLERLGAKVADVHGLFVDEIARQLPRSPSDGPETPWWRLDERDRYLCEHLIEHLISAGRLSEAEAVACDLRWVESRLSRFGQAAPYVDLMEVGSTRAVRLGTVFAQAAHLLGNTEPTTARRDVLYSRVQHDPEWGAQIAALQRELTGARLTNRWPLPDLPDPALRRSLVGHVGPVTALAISPDGAWLASGGVDKAVRVWTAATGDLRFEFKGHGGTISTLAISPNMAWLASGSDDRAAIVWDLSSGRQVARLARHQDSVHAIDFSPDSKWLVTADSAAARIWYPGEDRRTAKLSSPLDWAIDYFPGVRAVHAIAVSPSGRQVAIGRRDGTVELWDVATRRLRAELPGSNFNARIAERWDVGTEERPIHLPAGVEVRVLRVAEDDRIDIEYGDGRRCLWDPDRGSSETVPGDTAVIQRPRPRPSIGSAATAGDGSWYASGGHDGVLHIWDATLVSNDSSANSRDVINAVAVDPGGAWVVSGSDLTTRVWDLAIGDGSAAPSHDLARSSGEVAIARDGTWIATTDSRGRFSRYDLPDGTQRWEYVQSSQWGSPVEAIPIAITPDGGWVVSGGGGGLQLRDAVSGNIARRDIAPQSPSAPISAVATVPASRTIVSGCTDGTIQIWKAEIPTMPAIESEWRGHVGVVHSIAVSPDGGWFASGGQDGKVCTWDLAASGYTNTVLIGHTGRVRTVSVAPDGRHLASGGDDQTLRIWDVPRGSVVAVMRVNGGITSCAWTPDATAIIVGGSSGLYCFAFQSGSAVPTGQAELLDASE